MTIAANNLIGNEAQDYAVHTKPAKRNGRLLY